MYHINLNLKQSQNIVSSFHRHSKPLARHMFSIGVVEHRCSRWSECFGIVTVDRCSSSWSKRRDHVSSPEQRIPALLWAIDVLLLTQNQQKMVLH